MNNDLENSLRCWLDENGYDDFNISAGSSLSISGDKKIAPEDIKKIKNELNIHLKQCKIRYNDPFEKSEVSYVEYEFENHVLNDLNDNIYSWFTKKGYFPSVFSYFNIIRLHLYEEISKDLINEFEEYFDVKLGQIDFYHEPSSEGCVKSRIDYKFYMN